MQIKFKKLCKEAVVPEYQTAGSAGMDICAIEGYVLMPGERKVFQTGLAVAVEDGYEVQVRARSGLSAKEGVTVINGVGTIDSDYRGQIGVALVNLNHNCHVTIHKGDRIAQLVVNKIEQPEIIVVDELGETIRGEGGFGSTGK
jgi:dUTP pyrophosphatase